jgi:hypothetical protein
MTIQTRRPQRIGVRARLGRLTATEERQQVLITVLFIAVIAAVALILLGAIGVGWYNDNLRALGKVGSVEIGPQTLRDKIGLEQFRINRDEGRVTQAQVAGQLTADEANAKDQALQTRSSNLSTTALESIVDSIYQSQLAPDNGVTVADSDVQAAYEQEISDPEQRHVYVVSSLLRQSTRQTVPVRPSVWQRRTEPIRPLPTCRVARTLLRSRRHTAPTTRRAPVAIWAPSRRSRLPTTRLRSKCSSSLRVARPALSAVMTARTASAE